MPGTLGSTQVPARTSIESYLEENVSRQAVEVEFQKMESEDALNWSFDEWYETKRFYANHNKDVFGNNITEPASKVGK